MRSGNLLTGAKPEPNELRRFVLTQPVLDYSALEPAKRATDAIHDAARALALYCDLVARSVIDGLSQGQVDTGVDTGEAEVLADLRPAEEVVASAIA